MPDNDSILIEQLEGQVAGLERKAKAREGRQEYRDSLPLLKSEMARLRAVLASIRGRT